MGTVVAISSARKKAAVDLRQFTGDNLLRLLDLPADSRVLIFGTGLEGWREVFRQVRFQAPFAGPSPGGGCSLVLYHSGCANSSKELAEHLKQLRGVIAPHASLLVFAENFYSFSNLKRLRYG